MDNSAVHGSDDVDVCYCSDDEDRSDVESTCNDNDYVARDDNDDGTITAYRSDNDDCENQSDYQSDDDNNSHRFSSHDTSYNDVVNDVTDNDALLAARHHNGTADVVYTDDARNNNADQNATKQNKNVTELSFGINRILTEDSPQKSSSAKRPSLDSIVSNLTTLRGLQAHHHHHHQHTLQVNQNQLAYGYFQHVLSQDKDGSGSVLKISPQRLPLLGGLGTAAAQGAFSAAGASALPWMQERKDRLTSK